MSEPQLKKEFWSFIIRGIKTEGGQATVTGWFVICRIESLSQEDKIIQDGIDQTFHFDYLTPVNEPVTLDVSSMLPNIKVEDISPKIVAHALQTILKLPYQDIPRAPLSTPLHRMPPSKRRKLQKARQQRGDVRMW